jgi:hypothetical protein
MYLENYSAGSTSAAKANEPLPAELGFLLAEAPAESTTTTYVETLMLLEASEDILHMMFETAGVIPDKHGLPLIQN